MISVIETALNSINVSQWDEMNVDNQPFLKFAFLNGLEVSGCISAKNGWEPQHIVIYRDENKSELLAAIPCYLKNHSYGEYIFDWAWADGYQRAGRAYYPKLSCAIPFTPATTPIWLIKAGEDKETIISMLLKTLKDHAIKLRVSSIHALFTNIETNQYLEKYDFIQRSSSQFHWLNQSKNNSSPYSSFDHFLADFNSRKRKNIKRERRRVSEQGIHYRWYTGANLTVSIATLAFGFYLSTIYRYGAQQYLNMEFFKHFMQKMPDSTHILIAYLEDKPVAGGLYFASNSTLYGRYWGATVEIQDLHFETCYYQPIEYAIKNQLQRFEAGAQGEHKLARGLLPTTTYSMHWLADEDFREAVLNFTKTEAQHIEKYNNVMGQHGPFKQFVGKAEI